MPRRTIDTILTGVGTVMTLALLVAGGLLTWGYVFANSNVHDQLAAQKIYFPAKGSPALASPQIGPYLNRYAGREVVTGAQAKAYADHFIAVHLKETAGGRTYAQISSELRQNPNDTQLKQTQTTLFQGTALRGMLLDAYAFWQLGQIALWSAIASFTLAGLMLILVLLGLLHLRRSPRPNAPQTT